MEAEYQPRSTEKKKSFPLGENTSHVRTPHHCPEETCPQLWPVSFLVGEGSLHRRQAGLVAPAGFLSHCCNALHILNIIILPLCKTLAREGICKPHVYLEGVTVQCLGGTFRQTGMCGDQIAYLPIAKGPKKWELGFPGSCP